MGKAHRTKDRHRGWQRAMYKWNTDLRNNSAGFGWQCSRVRILAVRAALVIPVAFLISFGIPGIPGELLLFAGPFAMVLGIPPEAIPLFLTLYLGLQIGLPDSFRTGGNTTNNYVYAILLNEVYESRFLKEEPQYSD